MILILALFGFGISLGLFFLAIIGAVLTLALRTLTGILWIAVKLLEYRKAEPEITILIEDDECLVMRDVTPRKATPRINAPRW